MASQKLIIDAVIIDVGKPQGVDEDTIIERCRERCIEHLKYTRPQDWDHYSSAQQPWREEERRVVEEFLIRFRPAQLSNIALYSKIAALLPRKNARDVAVMIAAMRKEERTLFEEEEKRQQQKSLQAQVVAAKANAQALTTQVAARTGAVPGMEHLLGSLGKPPLMDPILQTFPTPSKRGRGRGRPPLRGRGSGRVGRPPNTGRMQVPLTKPAPKQKEEFEMLIHKTLQGNVLIIGKMRENLLTGKLMDNYALMQRFDENINIILSMLDSLQCRMPPLPVQVNKMLLSTNKSQNDASGGLSLNLGNLLQQTLTGGGDNNTLAGSQPNLLH